MPTPRRTQSAPDSRGGSVGHALSLARLHVHADAIPRAGASAHTMILAGHRIGPTLAQRLNLPPPPPPPPRPVAGLSPHLLPRLPPARPHWTPLEPRLPLWPARLAVGGGVGGWAGPAADGPARTSRRGGLARRAGGAASELGRLVLPGGGARGGRGGGALRGAAGGDMGAGVPCGGEPGCEGRRGAVLLRRCEGHSSGRGVCVRVRLGDCWG
jgi:hypothetical protein